MMLVKEVATIFGTFSTFSGHPHFQGTFSGHPYFSRHFQDTGIVGRDSWDTQKLLDQGTIIKYLILYV
jgi:hypothetical protein